MQGAPAEAIAGEAMTALLERKRATADDAYLGELEAILKSGIHMDKAKAMADRARRVHLAAFSGSGDEPKPGRPQGPDDRRYHRKVFRVPANYARLRELAKAEACAVVGIDESRFSAIDGTECRMSGRARTIAACSLWLAFGTSIAAKIYGASSGNISCMMSKWEKRGYRDRFEAEAIALHLAMEASAEYVEMTNPRT